MASAIAFARNTPFEMVEPLRLAIVISCALALIAAGQPLPF